MNKDKNEKKNENKVVNIFKNKRIASTEPLRKHLEQMKEDQKKEAIPYGEYLKRMSEKFVLKRASEHYIKFKKQGKPNEVAHYFANDEVKSEAINKLVDEITKINKLYNSKELKDHHMLNFLKMSGEIAYSVKFMDKNWHNKYTHYLSDMEMLSEMSAEKKKELFDIKE